MRAITLAIAVLSAASTLGIPMGHSSKGFVNRRGPSSLQGEVISNPSKSEKGSNETGPVNATTITVTIHPHTTACKPDETPPVQLPSKSNSNSNGIERHPNPAQAVVARSAAASATATSSSDDTPAATPTQDGQDPNPIASQVIMSMTFVGQDHSTTVRHVVTGTTATPCSSPGRTTKGIHIGHFAKNRLWAGFQRLKVVSDKPAIVGKVNKSDIKLVARTPGVIERYLNEFGELD